MWVTVTTPGTELDAADRGLGCLGVAAVSFAEQERRTAEYHRRIQSCDPVGSVVTDQVTTQNFLYCHEDIDVRGRPSAARMAASFNLRTRTCSGRGRRTRPAPTRASATRPPSDEGDRRSGRASGRCPKGIAIGDPHRIIEEIRAVGERRRRRHQLHPEHREVIAQEDVLACLRLFAGRGHAEVPRP